MLTSLELKIGGALLLIVALCVGFGLWQSHERSLGKAEAEAKQATAALVAEQAARAESDRRTLAVTQKANDADAAASAARADAIAAHTAGDRLRLRLAAAERSRSAVNTPAAGASSPTDSPAFVSYGVFEGIRSAGEQLGAYADQLRVSLDACIGSYTALTP